jgi:integrative and conjugative element protein (TIGR02256 family)
VSGSVFSAIIRTVIDEPSLETGGMLLGYRTKSRELVVVDAVGPGPGATHRRFSFEPDGPWQREHLHRIYWASDGLVRYLGDWHTHPGGLPIPSKRDVKTARAVASSKDAQTPNPVTTIVGFDEEAALVRCFVYAKRDLHQVPLRSYADSTKYSPELPGLHHSDLIDTVFRTPRVLSAAPKYHAGP